MAKRFTDTNIWQEDWFLAMPQDYMLFWGFITDSCDHAGIWKPNKVVFEKLSGGQVDLKKALSFFNHEKDRVVVLENGRWFITGFIPFQYGEVLNLASRMHHSVYDLLRINRVKLGLIRPQIEVIDRVKDKDKDKDKDIDLKEMEDAKKPSMDQVKEYFQKLGAIQEAEPFYNHYEAIGWKKGLSRIENWPAACRSWLDKPFRDKNKTSTQKFKDGIKKDVQDLQEWEEITNGTKNIGVGNKLLAASVPSA